MCSVGTTEERRESARGGDTQISLTNYSQNTEMTKRRQKLNEMVENLRKIVDQSSVKRSTRLLKISIDSTKYRSIADNFSVDSTFREIGRLDRSIRSVPGTTRVQDSDSSRTRVQFFRDSDLTRTRGSDDSDSTRTRRSGTRTWNRTRHLGTRTWLSGHETCDSTNC